VRGVSWSPGEAEPADDGSGRAEPRWDGAQWSPPSWSDSEWARSDRPGLGTPPSPPAHHRSGGYQPQGYPPEGYRPEAYQPGAYQPEAYQPEAYQPEAYQPEAYQPDAYQPDGYQPEAYQPDAYQPDGYRFDPYPGADYGSNGSAPERPTEQLPRYRDVADQARPTGPIVNPITARSRALQDRLSAQQAAHLPPASGPATEPARRRARTDPGDDGPSTEVSARLDVEPVADVGPPAPAATTAAPATEVPAGLGPDDEKPAVEPSALWMWITLIVQGVLGAVGGAAAWVGFRYLWLNLPVVALAAAVAATVGLVLLVRAIRGSDDPQTTILAVLVGLVVTISPAVLLLAVR
jgi:hypothetical protein